MFGLSGQWLLNDGELIPSSIVLSHTEQLTRLEADCPEAVDAAVLAGDPCLDRILASVPWRPQYRRAFGVDSGTKLIVVTSTWGHNSLLGRNGDLLDRLLASLPMDEFRVAAVLHPNIWHGHSPWQVRAWLARCRRAGLVVVPPREGWRAALVSADLVIGDHGSVTFYGAALGRPVLLGAFPHDDVDDRSPVAELGRSAPHIDERRPLLAQVERAISGHAPEAYRRITRQASSDPGESGRLLRAELYRLLKLPEPAAPVVVRRVPEPVVPAVPVTAVLSVATWEHGHVTVRRYPAAVIVGIGDIPVGAHLVVDESEEEPRLLELADVVVCGESWRQMSGEDWLAQALSRYPAAYLSATRVSPGATVIRVRDGARVRVSDTGGDGFELHASIVYSWLAEGRPLSDLPSECVFDARGARRRVSLTVIR